MNQNTEKRGYSVEDVIRMYGISRQSVYNEINNGNLKTFKIGRRRLVTSGSLRDWESLLENKAAAEVS